MHTGFAPARPAVFRGGGAAGRRGRVRKQTAAGDVAPGMDVTVTDAPDQHRYEARTDGQLAGFAAYQKAGNLVVFTHTEVDPAYEGHGVGSAIARGALDDVRRQHLPVLPLCPFIKGWIDRHRDYADLVYSARPSRVSD